MVSQNARNLIISAVGLFTWIALGGMIYHFTEYNNSHDKVIVQVPIQKNASEMEIQLLLVNTATSYGNTVFVNITRDNRTILLEGFQSTADRWDYFGAIFFVTTVVTTIGYGNISPSTSTGKAVLAPYSLIGIPLFIIMMSSIAEQMKTEMKRLRNRLRRGDCKEYKLIQIIIISSIGFVLFMLAPAVIFMAEEDWTFGEGLYYCFVTLTTIGFGDYVAGQQADIKDTRALYRVFISLWIIFGLSYFSIWIGAIVDFITSFHEKIKDSADKPQDKAVINDETIREVDGEDEETVKEEESTNT